MGNIIGETDCISSRYSNEVESEMEEGKKREKKRKLGVVRRDALDQEQKVKKKQGTNKMWQ